MRLTHILILVATLCAPLSAMAESASTYLGVTLIVAPNCRIAVTDLAFGSYDPLVANAARELDATADLRMLCTRNAQANIGLDFGRNNQGLLRSMAAGTDHVMYQLYQDASRTKLWGFGENALRIVGAGSREPQRFVVYGRVAGGQEVPPGAYTDVVLATVDF
jgi:spore coat protein U-like protein